MSDATPKTAPSTAQPPSIYDGATPAQRDDLTTLHAELNDACMTVNLLDGALRHLACIEAANCIGWDRPFKEIRSFAYGLAQVEGVDALTQMLEDARSAYRRLAPTRTPGA